LFADDGALYKEEYTDSFRFSYTTRTDIEAIIYNQLFEFLKLKQLRDFYYSRFTSIAFGSDIIWINKTTDTNQSTGFIGSIDPVLPYKTGSYTSTLLRFITPGALVKFEAPFNIVDGQKIYTKYFDKNNNNALVNGPATSFNSATTLWCKIVSVNGDGTNNGTGTLVDGVTGTILLNDIIPSQAVLSQIIPAWRTTIETNTVSTMVDLVFANKPFGLRYDVETRTWKIVFEVNLNTAGNFSLGKQGDNSNQQLDASWLILFTTDSEFYNVKSRLVRFIFESDTQLRFFFDASDKIYDTRSNTVVKDQIKVLNINKKPDNTEAFTYDRNWEITEEFIGLDGYVDTKKIQVTFSDSDDDSIVDNPDIFEEIVAPTVNPTDKFVVLELYTIEQGQEDYRWIDNSNNIVIVLATEPVSGIDGQYYYFIDTNVVKKYSLAEGFTVSLNYKVYQGRDNIKFQYIHNADYESRIDPGLTNLIDVFILTKDYDKSFREWLDDSITTEPLAPSSDFLYNMLSPELNKIKSISDEIIYHPVKYKVLFGDKASAGVQATFKIVKNSEVVTSDNDIKSKVLSAINEFFALENWDFGGNFYFTELSAYVMNRLAPNIVNFIIVPRQSDLTFGSLYEIRAESDQIFINGATVNNIEIISAITASKIKSSGIIAALPTVTSQQIITSAGTN
jgi:signal peptidase I